MTHFVLRNNFFFYNFFVEFYFQIQAFCAFVNEIQYLFQSNDSDATSTAASSTTTPITSPRRATATSQPNNTEPLHNNVESAVDDESEHSHAYLGSKDVRKLWER